MKYFSLLSLLLISLHLSAQVTSYDKVTIKTGGTLTIKPGAAMYLNNYGVTGISNDPALADSSTLDLVTEAAVNAFVKAYVAANGGDVSQIRDADGNTKIQVEESPNEDIIRFDLAGTERMVLKVGSQGQPRLEVLSANENLYIGTNVGDEAQAGALRNSAIGYYANYANNSGDDNTYMGWAAGNSNASGNQNAAFGSEALERNTSSNNSALGFKAGYLSTSAFGNSIFGANAGSAFTTGDFNSVFGDSAYISSTNFTNVAVFGYNSQPDASNQIRLGNTSSTQLWTGNYRLNIDQTVGSGQDNYVLTYDNATGEIGLEASASGGTTDLSYTAATGVVANTNGTGFTIPVATNSVRGLMPGVSGLGSPGGGVDPANDKLPLGDNSSGLIAGPSVNEVVQAVAAGGDMSGTINNLQIVADAVTGAELATGAVVLSSGDVTGTLAATNGGTGLSTYTTGDIIYSSATNTLSKLAGVATGNALISGGVATAPSWGKIGLTTHVSGTLPIANGGTNLTTYTTGDLIYASATNTLSKLAVGSNGQVLTLAGGVPTWAAASSGITGSGANTQVAYWNGTSSQTGSAAFTFDGTKESITTANSGTTTLLALSNSNTANSSADIQLSMLNGNNRGLVFRQNSNKNLAAQSYITADSLLVIDGDPIQIKVAGTLVSGFNSSGYFGLGTVASSPTSWIHVNTTGSATNDMMTLSSSAAGSSVQSRATISAVSNSLVFLVPSSNYGGSQTATLTSTQKMNLVSTAGQVGINTASPSESLSVTGNISASGVIKNGDGSASAPAYTFGNGTTSGLFRPSTGIVAVALSGAEYARFTTTGLNLGVAGTSLGAVKISGNTSGTVTLTTAAAAGTYTFTLPTGGGTSGYVLSTDGSGTTTWVANGGFTGSGTAGRVAYYSGTNALTSASSFLFDGTNFTVTNPMYTSSTGSASAPSVAFSGDANNGWWAPAADVQAWTTAGTERMRLSASGLGVGTSTLTYTGNFQGSFNSFIGVVSPNAVGNAGWMLENSGDGNDSWTGYRDGTGIFVLAHSTAQPFSAETRVLEATSTKIASKANSFNFNPITATVASALSPSNGDIIYVSSTNATFTTVGFWKREAGSWIKF